MKNAEKIAMLTKNALIFDFIETIINLILKIVLEVNTEPKSIL